MNLPSLTNQVLPSGQFGAVNVRRRAVILSIIIIILGISITLLPPGYDLEERLGLEFLFNLRGSIKPPDDTVIVALDDLSADRLHLPRDVMQWPRTYYARLIRYLADHGARVIVFDLIFNESKTPGDDAELAAAMKEAGNVMLVAPIYRETRSMGRSAFSPDQELIIETVSPPIDAFRDAAFYYAPFPLPKVPMKVSQFWTFKQTGDVPTLPAAVLQAFALDSLTELKDMLNSALSEFDVQQASDIVNSTAREEALWLTSLSSQDIDDVEGMNHFARAMKAVMGRETLIGNFVMMTLSRVTAHGAGSRRYSQLMALASMYRDDASQYLNFYGPPQTINTIPAYKLIQAREYVSIGDDFRDKAVFIGVSDKKPFKAGDTYYTVFSQADGLDLSGVEIAATAFGNLLERRTIKPPSVWMCFFIIGLFGACFAVICIMLEPMISLLVILILAVIYLIVAYKLFSSYSLWYPIIIPLTIQAPVAFILAIMWNNINARKLKLAHEQLLEMNRLKSMFLSHVSHELKTPLTSIKGFVDNMTSGLTGDIGEKQLDYLRRIRNNTDRLTRMIANLLDVSRIESGMEQLDCRPVSVCNLVHDSVIQLQLMADSRQIDLEVCCKDPSLRVMADPDKIIEVITNLVDNAIKYTPAGGRISINARLQGTDKVMLSVADTGIGIPTEDISGLFKPFHRSIHTENHPKGLGLGLSIVRHIVELHKGSITVSSEIDKGTEFRVLLPAYIQPEEVS